MIPERRFVFDTSVVVSAALFERSVPGRAFSAGLESGSLLLSGETFAELSEVLHRPKFDRYLDPEDRDEFLAKYLREARLVEVHEELDVCRDPKDNKYLELAISGNATFVVTGDQDLLVLNPFRGISIVTPAEFLDRIAKED